MNSIERGFIKAALETGFMEDEARGLIKRGLLERALNLLRPAAAFRPPAGLGRHLVDFGVPLGAGTTAGVYANQEGMNPTGSLATGLGAAWFANPRNFRNYAQLFRSQMASGNPINAVGKEAMKDIGIKGLLTGGGIGLSYAPEMLNKAKDTLDKAQSTATNIQGITGEAQKGMTGQSTNIAKFMTNAANTSENLAGSSSELSKTLRDTREFMGDAAESGKKLTDALTSGPASQGIAQGGEAARTLNEILKSVQSTGKSAVQFGKDNWMPITGGAAGLYLLGKLLSRPKVKVKNHAPQH